MAVFIKPLRKTHKIIILGAWVFRSRRKCNTSHAICKFSAGWTLRYPFWARGSSAAPQKHCSMRSQCYRFLKKIVGLVRISQISKGNYWFGN